jgi:hypothetical protein
LYDGGISLRYDHKIERWDLVILAPDGPRYRGLNRGEVGEVISTLYKGEFRVKAPSGDVSYYRPSELAFWEEGPSKPERNRRARSFHELPQELQPQAIARNRSGSCLVS